MRLNTTAPLPQLQCIPAFSDNYIWLLHDGQHAWVVDPGDAGPVRAALQAQGLILAQVIAVPGHTAGHVAYFGNHVPGGPLLFCGDTLFSGGCGRLFEGTPAQMLASLDRLNGLPAATRVCCAHEYTLSNLRFAQAVEPGNAALQAYLSHCEALRARGAPTLPSQLATERLVNPFLRSRDPGLRAGLAALATVPDGDVAVFATLRELKNNFRPA